MHLSERYSCIVSNLSICVQNNVFTFSAAGSYLMVYNVLDYPGGVVRMTSVTQEDNELMRNYPDHDKFHRKVKEVMNLIMTYQN